MILTRFTILINWFYYQATPFSIYPFNLCIINNIFFLIINAKQMDVGIFHKKQLTIFFINIPPSWIHACTKNYFNTCQETFDKLCICAPLLNSSSKFIPSLSCYVILSLCKPCISLIYILICIPP